MSPPGPSVSCNGVTSAPPGPGSPWLRGLRGERVCPAAPARGRPLSGGLGPELPSLSSSINGASLPAVCCPPPGLRVAAFWGGVTLEGGRDGAEAVRNRLQSGNGAAWPAARTSRASLGRRRGRPDRVATSASGEAASAVPVTQTPCETQPERASLAHLFPCHFWDVLWESCAHLWTVPGLPVRAGQGQMSPGEQGTSVTQEVGEVGAEGLGNTRVGAEEDRCAKPWVPLRSLGQHAPAS